MLTLYQNKYLMKIKVNMKLKEQLEMKVKI